MKLVAIMQPTYLPWIGYFGLMDVVDEFILLDTVQFSRRSWQQRNQIKLEQKDAWLTVPVISKKLRNQKIHQVEIDPSNDFIRKHIRTIEIAYSKSRYFRDYSDILFEILQSKHEKLSDLNIELIQFFKNILYIETPLKRSSELENVGSKDTLLANICSQIGATEYLSPPGSKGYLAESNAFKNIGIQVKYLDFMHPVYPQQSDNFIPNMSIIDLLFNVGPSSLNYIRSGCGIEND